MELIITWTGAFAAGAWLLLRIYLVAVALTVIWGLLGATAKLAKNPLVRGASHVYTTVFRGTPELLVLFLIYFGSATTLTAIAQHFDSSVKFLSLPTFWAGALSLSLVMGAYATETFRGAFQGVDRGQVEAARALGISSLHAFIHIRLPQMWRLALPAFGNHLVSLMKNTALLRVIGIEEVMYVADRATNLTNRPFTVYLTVMIIYLVFVTVITAVIGRLERAANRHLELAR